MTAILISSLGGGAFLIRTSSGAQKAGCLSAK
jgi:hypothetical protein